MTKTKCVDAAAQHRKIADFSEKLTCQKQQQQQQHKLQQQQQQKLQQQQYQLQKQHQVKHKQHPPRPAGPSLNTKQKRKVISPLITAVFYPDQLSKTKVRNLYQQRPDGYDKDVPFGDPQNKNEKFLRPSSSELDEMIQYLLPLYNQMYGAGSGCKAGTVNRCFPHLAEAHTATSEGSVTDVTHNNLSSPSTSSSAASSLQVAKDNLQDFAGSMAYAGMIPVNVSQHAEAIGSDSSMSAPRMSEQCGDVDVEPAGADTREQGVTAHSTGSNVMSGAATHDTISRRKMIYECPQYADQLQSPSYPRQDPQYADQLQSPSYPRQDPQYADQLQSPSYPRQDPQYADQLQSPSYPRQDPQYADQLQSLSYPGQCVDQSSADVDYTSLSPTITPRRNHTRGKQLYEEDTENTSSCSPPTYSASVSTECDNTSRISTNMISSISTLNSCTLSTEDEQLLLSVDPFARQLTDAPTVVSTQEMFDIDDDSSLGTCDSTYGSRQPRVGQLLKVNDESYSPSDDIADTANASDSALNDYTDDKNQEIAERFVKKLTTDSTFSESFRSYLIATYGNEITGDEIMRQLLKQDCREALETEMMKQSWDVDHSVT